MRLLPLPLLFVWVACSSDDTVIASDPTPTSTTTTETTATSTDDTSTTAPGTGGAEPGEGGSGGDDPISEGGGGAGGENGTGGDGGTGGGGTAPELGPGSLAFIGVNSDLPEGFALVPLVDLPSGTQLRFSERAWNATNDTFEAAEGTATLTLTTAVDAGQVFEMTVNSISSLTVTPAIGNVVNDATGNWGIAGNGDNLFVYTGPDSAPTFIAGIAFSSPSVWTTMAGSLDGQSSMIPTTLSELAGTITTFSADNLRYNGDRDGLGSFASYAPLIADEMRYDTGNAAYTPLRGTDFSL